MRHPASLGNLEPIARYPTFNDAAHSKGRRAAADGDAMSGTDMTTAELTNPGSSRAATWSAGRLEIIAVFDRGTERVVLDWPAA